MLYAITKGRRVVDAARGRGADGRSEQKFTTASGGGAHGTGGVAQQGPMKTVFVSFEQRLFGFFDGTYLLTPQSAAEPPRINPWGGWVLVGGVIARFAAERPPSGGLFCLRVLDELRLSVFSPASIK